MGEVEASAIAAVEIQKASMVTLFGVTFNVYAAILVVIFAVFLIAIFRAQRAHRFDWMDMVTRDGTKISATKVLQLVGGIVGTWIVIQLTLQGGLDWDIFAIYLSYVASIDGFSKLIMAKYGAENSDDSAWGRRRGRGRHDHYDDRDSYPFGKNDYVGSNGYNQQKTPANKVAPGGHESPEDFAEFEIQGGAKTGFDDN